MRVFISGQKHFGWSVFRLMKELDIRVTGVAAPLGKDRLYSSAYHAGLEVIPAGQLRAKHIPEDTDLIIAAHSHDFIGRKTRAAARLGAIGYHPSLLPLHRGRSAIEWALRMHDKVTGGSVFWLNDTVDGGPLAAQDFCLIRPGDTPRSLWERELSPMGLRLLGETLIDIGSGVLRRVPQDKALATWEPAINQPPLHRPELPELGAGGFEGFEVKDHF